MFADLENAKTAHFGPKIAKFRSAQGPGRVELYGGSGGSKPVKTCQNRSKNRFSQMSPKSGSHGRKSIFRPLGGQIGFRTAHAPSPQGAELGGFDLPEGRKSAKNQCFGANF